jgi:hypothetical protein
MDNKFLEELNRITRLNKEDRDATVRLMVIMGLVVNYWKKKYQKSLILHPLFYILGFLTAYFLK